MTQFTPTEPWTHGPREYPDDVLGCGHLRSAHDAAENCGQCSICDRGLCPADEDVLPLGDDFAHRDCILAERRRNFLEALRDLFEEAALLNAVHEEALLTAADLAVSQAHACEVYDGLDYLHQWAERNAKQLGEWAIHA